MIFLKKLPKNSIIKKSQSNSEIITKFVIYSMNAGICQNLHVNAVPAKVWHGKGQGQQMRA